MWNGPPLISLFLPVAVNINCHAARHAEATIYKLKLAQNRSIICPRQNISGRHLMKRRPKHRLRRQGSDFRHNSTAARDAAHKKDGRSNDKGEELPVDPLEGQVVYYVGPSPAKPGHVIGSAGPTTSGRMDAYAPRLMACGLKGMIGKRLSQKEVVDAMENMAFHTHGRSGRSRR